MAGRAMIRRSTDSGHTRWNPHAQSLASVPVQSFACPCLSVGPARPNGRPRAWTLAEVEGIQAKMSRDVGPARIDSGGAASYFGVSDSPRLAGDTGVPLGWAVALVHRFHSARGGGDSPATGGSGGLSSGDPFAAFAF